MLKVVNRPKKKIIILFIDN